MRLADLPPQAQAIVRAIAHEEGCGTADLMRGANTRRLRSARLRCWAVLGEQMDGSFRMWSRREIGAWFGVTSQAVSIALVRAGDKVGATGQRAHRPRKSKAQSNPDEPLADKTD